MLRSDRYPPLTADEARALYAAAPSPELRRALWEIARLQAVVIDTERVLALREMAAPGMVEAARQEASKLREAIRREPGWMEWKAGQDASMAEIAGSWSRRRVR